jgi:hypothetical protein
VQNHATELSAGQLKHHFVAVRPDWAKLRHFGGREIILKYEYISVPFLINIQPLIKINFF